MHREWKSLLSLLACAELQPYPLALRFFKSMNKFLLYRGSKQTEPLAKLLKPLPTNWSTLAAFMVLAAPVDINTQAPSTQLKAARAIWRWFRAGASLWGRNTHLTQTRNDSVSGTHARKAPKLSVLRAVCPSGRLPLAPWELFVSPTKLQPPGL